MTFVTYFYPDDHANLVTATRRGGSHLFPGLLVHHRILSHLSFGMVIEHVNKDRTTVMWTDVPGTCMACGTTQDGEDCWCEVIRARS